MILILDIFQSREKKSLGPFNNSIISLRSLGLNSFTGVFDEEEVIRGEANRKEKR